MGSLDPQLAAVLAAPLDDAPRIALGEALQASGDPRGAFILAQCRLATRGLLPDVRAGLKAETATALREHEIAWRGAASSLKTVVMRRGFVDELTVSADDLASPCAAIFATEPVTRLTIMSASPATLLPLAKDGAFTRVVRLTIRGNLGDEGAKVLASALARRPFPLHSLNLGSANIGAEGALALGAALDGCRSLTLTGNPIGDEGVAALAKSKPLASLETLFITATDLTDEGIATLARSPNLTRLHRLGLARNDDITTDGLGALARSKKLKRLAWLEYSDDDGPSGQSIVTRP